MEKYFIPSIPQARGSFAPPTDKPKKGGRSAGLAITKVDGFFKTVVRQAFLGETTNFGCKAKGSVRFYVKDGELMDFFQ